MYRTAGAAVLGGRYRTAAATFDSRFHPGDQTRGHRARVPMLIDPRTRRSIQLNNPHNWHGSAVS